VSTVGSALNAVSLATAGITAGAAARAFTVGAAGVVYQDNPRVLQIVSEGSQGESSRFTSLAARRLDGELLEGVSARAPQSFDDFVKLFATTDGEEGVEHYVNADVFTALGSAWDANALRSAKARMIHSFWVYASWMAFQADTMIALAEFEERNPGRGRGTVLHALAKATHEAWLSGEKAKPDYVPYNQAVHDLISAMISDGLLKKEMAAHIDPSKKFRLKMDDVVFPMGGPSMEFREAFERATGRPFFDNQSNWVINTVAGEWDDLLEIEVKGEGAAKWSELRPDFLFGLQIANVAAVLYGLKQEKILKSLASGSTGDRLQSLVEMLRKVNAAWRVNNPWGGLNSPLIRTPFALAEDGGIGIDDIMKDAVTLKATLEELERARVAGAVDLSGTMAAGLESAFSNGLQEILEVMVVEEALKAAVKINTGFYNHKGEED